MKRLISKPLILLFAALAISLTLAGQIYDPVSWSFSYEKKGESRYEIIFTAEIEEGSYLYAMDVPEGGPIPTSFSFDTVPGWTFDGSVYEVTQAKEKFDEAFGFNIRTFSDRAEFRLAVNSGERAFSVKGTVNFMSCNSSTCSPPTDVEFEIKISDDQAGLVVTGNEESGLAGNEPRRGLVVFFLLSMLAGFAGILTPCVFPMIPMTVAFFSRDTGSRRKSIINAVVFGLSIILIYSSLGIIVSLTSAGAGFANALSTHWIPNIIFFALFITFAVSFFGAFEIVLPNKWVAGADSKVDKGGILASFFMGLTTVIVSFSCTGPIVGALLVEAAGGDVLRPTVGMIGFGLAFALPFTIFALFPSVMSRIPKSGGWLNAVKVVLGFLMLAFSMKFLMTIDSVYNLGLLTRDIYLAVWIVLFVMLGLYLMGKIRFLHDSDLNHIGTFRFFLIIAVFSFALYLFTGLMGAPLKGLASLIPSPAASVSLNSSRPAETGPAPGSFPVLNTVSSPALCDEPRFGDKFNLPHGLKGYFDYEQGLACARESGKPALLDFKGHACANCKLMEARVWSDPGVLQRLRDNFVIIGLYVDDRTQLPEEEWYVSDFDGKTKKTIGKQNEDLEISKFNSNALPLYVITDHEGNPLNKPMPTNLNVDEFTKWLDEGLALFRSQNR